MEILTSVTEFLILSAIGWVILQDLADSEKVTHQEEPIPVPVENKQPPTVR